MSAHGTAQAEAAGAAATTDTTEAQAQAEPVVDPQAELAAQIVAAQILLLAHGYRIVTPNAQSARSTVVKADPDAVKTFFESTGLSRAELADAVGVSTSVIATVQNPNGDRWSLERFQRAQTLIQARVALKAATAKA